MASVDVYAFDFGSNLKRLKFISKMQKYSGKKMEGIAGERKRKK